MLLDHSCDEWPVQQPVVHRLVLEGNAADVPSPIHIPCPNAHTEFLRRSEVTPPITDLLFEGDRGCMYMHERERERKK